MMKIIIGISTFFLFCNYSYSQTGETLQSVTDRGEQTTNPITTSAEFRGIFNGVDLRVGSNTFIGGVGAFGTNSNHPIAFFSNALERMRVTENGNIGIGTSIVSNDQSWNRVLDLHHSENAKLLVTTNLVKTGIFAHDAWAGTFPAGRIGTESYHPLILMAGYGNDIVSINPNGYVDVKGILASSGNSTPGSTPVANIDNLANGIRINGNIGDHSQNGISYQSGAGGGAAISFYRGGAYNTGIDFYTNAQSNAGYGKMQHRMRLTEDGNLGIGTSNPQSKLAVNGIITSTKIKVTQDGWADYVFDSSYQLASLQQVETFIQKNKHLPDVPSAAEVKIEGLDLGDNQVALLKKIEELTLYIIEQHKQMQSQRQAIEYQKQTNTRLESRLSAIEKMLK